MAIRMKEVDHFSLDLTPMIDVVFLLIVFFLVSTTFQQMEREMKVDVPKSEEGSSGDRGNEPIVVNVLEDGKIVVRGSAVSLAQLESLMKHEVGGDQKTKAVIRGHSELMWSKVIDVASACIRAQAAVSFATLPPKGAPR